MSDLDLLLAVVAAYPRASAALAVLTAIVLIGANVRPSEAWALRHPFLFQCLRACRAIAANAVKAHDLLSEWRRDGSLAAVRAFFERGRATDPSAPPTPPPGPPAPGGSGLPVLDPDPTTETTPVSPSTLGGNARRA